MFMVDGDVFDDECGDVFCDADVDDNIDDVWDISKYLFSLHHASLESEPGDPSTLKYENESMSHSKPFYSKRYSSVVFGTFLM